MYLISDFYIGDFLQQAIIFKGRLYTSIKTF